MKTKHKSVSKIMGISEKKENELKTIKDVENDKEEDEEVKCANGCGMTCNPNDYVHGYCSRSCFNEMCKVFSDNF